VGSLVEVASHGMVFWSLSLGLFRGNTPAFDKLLLHTPATKIANLRQQVNKESCPTQHEHQMRMDSNTKGACKGS
jgi:hypothetical protein